MRIIPRKDIISLKPYQIEGRKYPVKLDANESPFDMDSKLKTALLNKLKKIEFNRYPDGNASELKKALAGYLKVKESNLCVGNGSDEVLQCIITAFCGKKDKVVFPVPSFSIYKILTLIAGAEPVSVNLVQRLNTFDLNSEAIAGETKKAKLLIIAYPNNPTGNCFSEDIIRNIIGHKKTIVIIDEAYHEFCGKTFLPLIKSHENLIVLRSFSKVLGLAGIRVGVAIANKNIIKEVEKVRLPYNVNSISQEIALFALKNKSRIFANIKKIIKERERLFDGLLKIKKVFPFKSDANFVLFMVENADMVYENLKKKGILVRNLNEPGILNNCLRVTVGTKSENNKFLKELKNYEKS